jgi:hypothetical protein
MSNLTHFFQIQMPLLNLELLMPSKSKLMSLEPWVAIVGARVLFFNELYKLKWSTKYAGCSPNYNIWCTKSNPVEVHAIISYAFLHKMDTLDYINYIL